MTCTSCHKLNTEPLTYWQRFRKWCFEWFVEDVKDLRDDRYTQGFGEGYKNGFEQGKKLINDSFDVLFNREKIKDTTMDTAINILDVIDLKKKGQLLICGQPLTERERETLRSEANMLQAFRLWSIFQETVKQGAIDHGLKDALNFEHTLAAKMMLHNLGILRSMVNVFSKEK